MLTCRQSCQSNLAFCVRKHFKHIGFPCVLSNTQLSNTRNLPFVKLATCSQVKWGSSNLLQFIDWNHIVVLLLSLSHFLPTSWQICINFLTYWQLKLQLFEVCIVTRICLSGNNYFLQMERQYLGILWFISALVWRIDSVDVKDTIQIRLAR